MLFTKFLGNDILTCMLLQEIVSEIEKCEDIFSTRRDTGSLKMAVLRHVPRQGLLKPEQAPLRLSSQTFGLGDRVIMAHDSGNVPLAAKGVIIGIQDGLVDVIFDVPVFGGSNLGER